MDLLQKFEPSDILRHGEEIKAILAKAINQSYKSLYDQDRAVLAGLGFIAAVATGGLAVQIIKKVN